MENRLTIFRGIPFAAPPIGALRWKAPQPVEKWDRVKQAFHLLMYEDETFTTGGQGINVRLNQTAKNSITRFRYECISFKTWNAPAGAVLLRHVKNQPYRTFPYPENTHLMPFLQIANA